MMCVIFIFLLYILNHSPHGKTSIAIIHKKCKKIIELSRCKAASHRDNPTNILNIKLKSRASEGDYSYINKCVKNII